MEKTENEVLRQMAHYCSTGERCVQEVQKKIANAGLSEEAQARILQRLIDERFIDERRYARSFTNDKLRFNKWGRVKIDYELRKKGIPDTLRQEALQAIDEEIYTQILADLLKSKLKSLGKEKDPRAIAQKLLRFAAGRGFESERIFKTFHQLTNSLSDENDENEPDMG